MRIFALQGSEALGSAIAVELACDLAPHEARDFEDGEHKSRPLVSVRGEDVFVVSSLTGSDGATVNAISRVNGTLVANDSFTWDSNGGQLRMDLGNNDPGNRIDNLTVSTVPEPSLSLLLGMAGLGLATRRRSVR